MLALHVKEKPMTAQHRARATLAAAAATLASWTVPTFAACAAADRSNANRP